MKLKRTVLKDKIAKIFKLQTYIDLASSGQNPDWQISPSVLKDKLGDSNIEIIAVLPNLKLPFKVHQTIPIEQFDADKITIDKKKTYIYSKQIAFRILYLFFFPFSALKF